MSSPAEAPGVDVDPNAGLSKAEIRRRKILAKRGARMALVTGDQTLAAADEAPVAAPSASPSQTSVQPVPATLSIADDTTAIAPSPSPVRNPSADLVALLGGMGAPPTPRRQAIVVPTLARNMIVVICALLVPALRASFAPRASALQLFLAAEAVVLAPTLTSGVGNGGGGLLGLLNTAVLMSGAMRAVYQDAALFMFALFCGLRLAEKLL